MTTTPDHEFAELAFAARMFAAAELRSTPCTGPSRPAGAIGGHLAQRLPSRAEVAATTLTAGHLEELARGLLAAVADLERRTLVLLDRMAVPA